METYNRQEKAAVKERELREAEARAKQQTTLTESELSITIQTNQGKADYARAQQQASHDEQVRAYGGPRFQLTQQVMSRFAEAIETARVDVVPKIVIQGGANGTPATGNVMEARLTLLLADRMGAEGPSSRGSASRNEGARPARVGRSRGALTSSASSAATSRAWRRSDRR